MFKWKMESRFVFLFICLGYLTSKTESGLVDSLFGAAQNEGRAFSSQMPFMNMNQQGNAYNRYEASNPTQQTNANLFGVTNLHQQANANRFGATNLNQQANPNRFGSTNLNQQASANNFDATNARSSITPTKSEKQILEDLIDRLNNLSAIQKQKGSTTPKPEPVKPTPKPTNGNNNVDVSNNMKPTNKPTNNAGISYNKNHDNDGGQTKWKKLRKRKFLFQVKPVVPETEQKPVYEEVYYLD